MNMDKCDKCKRPTLEKKLIKRTYNRFYWMFCPTCYFEDTTKVSTYFKRT